MHESLKKMSGKCTSMKPLTKWRIDFYLRVETHCLCMLNAAGMASSCDADPTIGLNPLSSGWKREEERWVPEWFVEDSLPSGLDTDSEEVEEDE